jgi:hypothetical protein
MFSFGRPTQQNEQINKKPLTLRLKSDKLSLLSTLSTRGRKQVPAVTFSQRAVGRCETEKSLGGIHFGAAFPKVLHFI